MFSILRLVFTLLPGAQRTYASARDEAVGHPSDMPTPPFELLLSFPAIDSVVSHLAPCLPRVCGESRPGSGSIWHDVDILLIP